MCLNFFFFFRSQTHIISAARFYFNFLPFYATVLISWYLRNYIAPRNFFMAGPPSRVEAMPRVISAYIRVFFSRFFFCTYVKQQEAMRCAVCHSITPVSGRRGNEIYRGKLREYQVAHHHVDGAAAPMHHAHAIDSCSGRYVEEERHISRLW